MYSKLNKLQKSAMGKIAEKKCFLTIVYIKKTNASIINIRYTIIKKIYTLKHSSITAALLTHIFN